MRRLAEHALGFASIGLTILLVLGIGMFALVDSDYGRAFLDEQSEAIVERVLGRDYVAELGRQSLGLDVSGYLLIRWDDIEVKRAGIAQPRLTIRSVMAGLDVPSLIVGRIAVRTLDVAGADIDVTGVPAASEVAATAQGIAPNETAASVTPPVDARAAKALLPALTERLLAGAEQQIGALERIGIKEVALSDMRLITPVAPGGGPFVARIDRVVMNLADPRAMRLSGMLSVDGTPIPIDAGIDYDPRSQRLTTLQARIGPLSLAKLIPPGDPNNPQDVRPFATTSDLRLKLDVASSSTRAPRSIQIETSLGNGHVQVGRGHTDVQSASLAFICQEGDDRVVLGPSRFLFDGLNLIVSGGLAPIYDRPGDNAFNGFALDVASTSFESTIGAPSGSPIEGRFKLSARTDLARREARLVDLDFRTGEGSLSGSAAYRYGAPDAQTELRIQASNLGAPAVKAFWPFNVAVAARRWVENNIRDEGRVIDGTIALDISKDRLAQASRPGGTLQPGELELRFGLTDVKSRSFGGLPDLIGVDGTVEGHGTDTLATIGAASVEGFPGVAVDGGLVSFVHGTGNSRLQTDVKIAANIGGKLDELARLAALPPLNAMRSLPIRPQDVQGTAKTNLDIDLKLGSDVPADQLVANWRVTLDLHDAGLKQPVEGRRISSLNGTIDLVRGALTGALKGSVDGAQGDVSFNRSLEAVPAAGRRMTLDLRIDGAEASKLAPVLNDIVAGPIKATIVEEINGVYRTGIDLKATLLNLPWIGWRKGKNVPAELAFNVRPREGVNEIEAISLKGESFTAMGEAQTDKSGFRSAKLRDVALNPGDDIDIAVNRVQNGYSMAIKGTQFDARPLLNDIRSDLGGRTAAAPKPGAAQFDVSGSVQKVLGFGGEAIDGFAINYAGSGSTIAALSMTGSARKGAEFSIDVSPRGKARSVDLQAADIGALARFSGAYAHMDGGKMTLSLLGSYADGYKGKLTVKNFSLVDEPRLSRLVAAPPSPNSKSLAQAVGQNLQTGRASFDHASAGILFGKSGLQLIEGIIRGPVFGSSFSGTLYDAQNRIDIVGSFMPAYGINRVFGAIPIFGQILGNGREGGLIGITYRLSGAFSSPKLEVNPISAIAPGIFRNIFAYQ